MLISPETQLCISLAAKPGRFGATIHNAGYQALDLNYIYKPCSTSNLEAAINGVKSLNIRGCSISMPFKQTVIKYLDELDNEAKLIGSVNTIVNNNGRLKGYNTDMTGVVTALSPFLTNKNAKILILGGGGVARAIIRALHKLNQHDITLKVRSLAKCEAMAAQYNLNLSPWSQEISPDFTCLINATPLGMRHTSEVAIDLTSLPKLNLVLDMVVASKTNIISSAQALNINSINGFEVALNQAYAQFHLYTGVEAPKEVMQQAALSIC